MTEIARLTLAAVLYLAPHAAYYQGRLALQQGDYERAIALFNEVISRNPKDPGAPVN